MKIQGKVMEMSGNFEIANEWQPCFREKQYVGGIVFHDHKSLVKTNCELSYLQP